MGLRVTGVLVAIAAAALMAPGAASATVNYCVNQAPNAAPPPCDATYADVQSALTQAKNSGGFDIVKISAGTFTAGGGEFDYDATAGTNPVQIVGAGPSTRLVKGGPGVVLAVTSSNASSIDSLTVVPTAGTAATQSVGIKSQTATIDSVIVDPSGASGYVTGFDVGGGELTDVTALLPPGAGGLNTAVKFTNGAATNAIVQRAALAGDYGIDSAAPDTYVNRTRISAKYVGVQARRNLTALNSLVRLTPATLNQIGIFMTASQNASGLARHLTIVGAGEASSTAVYGQAIAGGGGGVNLTLDVDNSIIRGFGSSFAATQSSPGPASPAVVTIRPRYSDFPPTTPGVYVPDASNVDLDPAFTDQYALTAGSPLIDAGTPGTFPSNDRTLDLAGNARFVDGNGDGAVRRDIGAFEYQSPPPSTPAGPAGGTPGGAGDPGTGGPPAAGAGGAGGPPAAVTALKLSPTRFRAATSGPAVTAAAKKKRKPPRGTTVTFTLSQAGSAAFTLERKTTGRRSGASCVKATRKNRKARRCTLYTAVKSTAFTRDGAAGVNKFRLTGRVGKKALKLGSYRLVATAAASVKRTSFKIVG
jgi:hypothetical protein